jgi:hypothetical protein
MEVLKRDVSKERNGRVGTLTIKNGERKKKENTRSTALSRSRPPSPYVQTAARGSTSRFFCFRSLSMLFFWIHDVMSTEPVLNSTAGHDRDTDGTRTGHGLDTDWIFRPHFPPQFGQLPKTNIDLARHSRFPGFFILGYDQGVVLVRHSLCSRAK